VTIKNRPDLAALAFCGLVVIACAVLAGLGREIPDFLPAVGMFVAGVGGGAALNERPATASSAEPAPAPVPAASVPAPRPPAPYGYPDPAETGVFARVVSGDH
jgi:hypothetical protein